MRRMWLDIPTPLTSPRVAEVEEGVAVEEVHRAAPLHQRIKSGGTVAIGPQLIMRTRLLGKHLLQARQAIQQRVPLRPTLLRLVRPVPQVHPEIPLDRSRLPTVSLQRLR